MDKTKHVSKLMNYFFAESFLKDLIIFFYTITFIT